MLIECPQCKGTGVYSGLAESKDTAVICSHCKGTGKYNYTYNYKEFTGRKKNNSIKRVYKKGSNYKIGTGKINFTGIDGFIDRCNSFNDGWLNFIPGCKNKKNMCGCWKLFEKGKII